MHRFYCSSQVVLLTSSPTQCPQGGTVAPVHYCASVCGRAGGLFAVQVSGANDYRLRDNVLQSILEAPGGQSPEGGQVQQGVMLVGPGNGHALDAAWVKTVGSQQTKVSADSSAGGMQHVAQCIFSQ